jgi:pheromone shutdown protein TraB
MLERHRENISFFYIKTKTIYWVFEILYFKGNKKYVTHLLEPQPDSKTIQEILPTDFLSQELLLKEINTTKPEEFDVFIENRDIFISGSNAAHHQSQDQRML